MITSDGGGLYTLSGNVYNNSPNTFHNVEFLNEFLFDTASTSPAIDLPFSGGSWSATIDSSLDTLTTYDTPAGTLEMLPTNTNVPLSSGPFDDTSGLLLSTDSPPYFTVGSGTVLGNTMTPFSETVQETSGSFPVIDLRGSFISTDPVPEPSTLALFGAGAVGALFFFGQRRRAAEI